MSTNGQPVIIGPITLAGLEIPELFDRAASMQPVIHRLIGGGRVVQLLGLDPKRRELRGILTGNDAVDRAILLEALRDSGAAVALTIGAWSENVVVIALDLQYTARGNVIRYRLEAEALPAAPTLLTTTVSSVVGDAVSDLAAAVTSIGSAGLISLESAASSLVAEGASLTASGASFAVAPTLDTTSVSASLSSAIASSGDTLISLSGSASPSIVNDAADLATATSNAQALAASLQAGGYVNRATASIAALSGATVLPAVHS